MPAPTAYTEQQLADFMATILGDIAADLGLVSTSLGDYEQSVYDVLFDYGETDISLITGTQNIPRLRAIARVHAWRLAAARCAARYDVQDGTQRLSRSQLQAMCKEMLEIALADMEQFSTADYAVGIDGIVWDQDPYSYLPDSARTIP